MQQGLGRDEEKIDSHGGGIEGGCGQRGGIVPAVRPSGGLEAEVSPSRGSSRQVNISMYLIRSRKIARDFVFLIATNIVDLYRREEFLKHENNELLKRLEAAEARSEELSESVSVATKPLLRQLEQLQANLLHKSNSYMKQEKVLSEKIIELQSKIENLMETDRILREENVSLKSKESQLESKLNLKEKEKTGLRESCNKLREENERLLEQTKQ